MVSRSAYAQLGYSPLLLVATFLGMAIIYALPPSLALFAGRVCAAARRGALGDHGRDLFHPIQRFYGLSPAAGCALPLIGALYTLVHAAIRA